MQHFRNILFLILLVSAISTGVGFNAAADEVSSTDIKESRGGEKDYQEYKNQQKLKKFKAAEFDKMMIKIKKEMIERAPTVEEICKIKFRYSTKDFSDCMKLYSDCKQGRMKSFADINSQQSCIVSHDGEEFDKQLRAMAENETIANKCSARYSTGSSSHSNCLRIYSTCTRYEKPTSKEERDHFEKCIIDVTEKQKEKEDTQANQQIIDLQEEQLRLQKQQQLQTIIKCGSQDLRLHDAPRLG